MKIALLGDTHFGARNDNPFFLENTVLFFKDIFFPYLEREKITTVAHLGDLVERRKYINFLTANKLRTEFINKIIKYDFHFILGNHDVYYKNTLTINSPTELYDKYITIYSKPTEVNFDGLNIAFVPWICKENEEEVLNFVENTKARVLFGHLELAGFETAKGSYKEDGMDIKYFRKFDLVCSGHYHHKSTVYNINYLGATSEYTWADYNDPKGFHVFDTETKRLTFIPNPLTVFSKLFYDDVRKTQQELLNSVTEDKCRRKIIKVILRSKTNMKFFEVFVSKIEKFEPISITMVDDHLNMDLVSDTTIKTEGKDTISIFKDYIKQGQDLVDMEALDKFIEELYQEANNI